MRTNSVVAALVGVLLVSGAFTLWASARYYFCLKELQRLQTQMLFINNVVNAAGALATDSLEYSKRNPAIQPLLQQYSVGPRQSPPAAATPAPQKPAGK